MPVFTFTHISGYAFRRCALGFIYANGVPSLDAKAHFDGLANKDSDLVRSRIGIWLEGKSYDKYHHGWPNNPKYKLCHVFKWEKRHKPQRLYGFKCHPKPDTAKGFTLCVLAYFDTKDDTTNYAILDRLNRLRQDPNVIAAVSIAYPEYGGKPKWAS
jgi:hypothetical protein